MDYKLLYDNFVEAELPRLQKLYDYYNGQHDILNKANRKNKVDAKLVNNYPAMITTFSTGFFMGEPVTYQVNEDKKVQFEKMYDYVATEEEQERNYHISELTSIFGKAYELAYINELKELKFKAFDPRDMVVIKDNTIEENIIGAFRFSSNKLDKDKYRIELEVYDATTITRYEWEEQGSRAKEIPQVTATDSRPHGFTTVPVIEYLNNTWAKGDFEPVISLIDGYNEATSTAIDDIKDFTSALLKIRNMSGTTEQDIEDMLKMGAFLVDDNGDADWMIKNINDAYSENIKNRTKQDIHKFSLVPDLTDEQFSGNTSGIAIKFKTLGLEQIAARKEMNFKRALNQRLSIIAEFLKLDIKPTEIKKIFTRNLPVNQVEEADTAQKLTGILSKSTILSRISGVEDVAEEIKKIENETNVLYNDYEGLGNEE